MLWLVVLLLAAESAGHLAAQQLTRSAPGIAPAQLVREVVYNEMHDHQAHGFWRYWIQRHSPTETRLEEQIETADGPITRLALRNGRPLNPDEQQAEEKRFQHLLRSQWEQAQQRQGYAEDEARIGKILVLLPDAFLYEDDGEENGCRRLRFRPNPSYPAHSIEARIFHAMAGKIWLDSRLKRLARLDGQVQENVDFGFGLLGRLYKGGWFQLQRTPVGPNDWKTQRLEIHMLGRALLLKNFSKETSETRGGFAPVPASMNLAQGVALLQKTVAGIDMQPHSGILMVNRDSSLNR